MCNFFQTDFINDLFISQNAPQMRALWILFISSVLQNRSLLCSCPWVRHARRLSLRDDTKSHFNEDCTFLFIRIRHSQDIFRLLFSENHLFVAYFASTCKVFFGRSVWSLPQRVTKSLSKTELSSLSLDLNQLVLQAQNTIVGATLRKTLRCFDTFFSETIPICFVRLSANILNVLHSNDTIKY